MKGHIIGSVPYGYIKENKMLKVNEEEKHILTRIFEDYASGKTILQMSAISSNGNAIRYYKCITTKKKHCLTGIIDKNFIERIIDKFLISQFNIPKNLNEISEKVFEIHKKRVGTNNTLNSLKSNLQKTNTSISNIMSAIEKGILTDTTKQRLEELEQKTYKKS